MAPAQTKLPETREVLKFRWIPVSLKKDAVVHFPVGEGCISPFEASSAAIPSSHFLEPPCCVTVWHTAIQWESREILAVWELLFLLVYAKNIIAKCIICCNLHIHTQHRSGQSSHKDAVPYFLLLCFSGQENIRSSGPHCARCCTNALKDDPCPRYLTLSM